MGTSSARRGPTTHLWRAAKRTATRYLSPAGQAPVAAREVVSRYVQALGESGGENTAERLAAFRLTRKAAQNLGDFCQKVSSQGWEAALQEAGLGELAGQPREVLAQALATVLGEPGGGLEEAVVRSSLASVWQWGLVSQEGEGHDLAADSTTSYLVAEPARLVAGFLAAALYQRLVLDLGESMEAVAPGWRRLKDRLSEIKGEIDAAAGKAAERQDAPRQWQGLAGWVWVTQVIEGMLAQFPVKSEL